MLTLFWHYEVEMSRKTVRNELTLNEFIYVKSKFLNIFFQQFRQKYRTLWNN